MKWMIRYVASRAEYPLMLFEPKHYQGPAIEFVKRVPRCALHAGVGSGKTSIILTAVGDMIMELDITRVLVLAPVNVILNTFPDELEKWDHTKWLTYSTLHGDSKDDAISEDTDIHLLNYEGLEWFKNNPNRKHYDLIVMDESHMVKDKQTKRFKMIRDIVAHTPRVIMMSGTPIGNSLLDLWSQFYLLDSGDRLFRTFEAFRATYFYQPNTYSKFKWVAYDWSEVAVVKKVEDITFQVHADDVEKTELTEIEIGVTLDDETLADYKEFEREYFIQIEDAEIEAFNAVTLSTKLRQFANGFMYYGDPSAHIRDVAHIHDRKYEALQKILSVVDENIMIVATFMEDFESLKEFFPHIKVINGRVSKPVARRRILAWNKGDIKLLAIHPRSVGTGLNLQDGGCRQIWLSPDWSYLAKHQTVGRVHRTGQTKDVTVEVLVAEGTIDEMIIESIADKTLTAEGFSKKLRGYRKLVLGRT